MSTGTEGRSLELYFVEGKPDGMLTAEVFNWTGHVLMTPRTTIAPALERKEARYTGVYLLLGETESGPRVYIGEAENIAERMRLHIAQKEWWSRAVLITSMANNLNKAHVRYLEARLIAEARSAGRAEIDNGNIPAGASLTEAGEANMKAFLNYLFMVLPAVGVDVFVRNTRPAIAASRSDPALHSANTFTLSIPRHGLTANAVLDDGDFVVLKGSLARKAWSAASNGYTGYEQLHNRLRNTGVLKEEGDHCVFTQNYAFSSPTAAAAVVYGSFIAGPSSWKLEDGRTYKEWEAAQLSDSTEPTE